MLPGVLVDWQAVPPTAEYGTADVGVQEKGHLHAGLHQNGVPLGRSELSRVELDRLKGRTTDRADEQQQVHVAPLYQSFTDHTENFTRLALKKQQLLSDR
jgi:hypothetical protein